VYSEIPKAYILKLGRLTFHFFERFCQPQMVFSNEVFGKIRNPKKSMKTSNRLKSKNVIDLKF